MLLPLFLSMPGQVSEEGGKKIQKFNEDLDSAGGAILEGAADLMRGHLDKVRLRKERGVPKEVLSRESRAFDLLVLGARGVNPAGSLLLGSVADFMLRNTACPLMLVRPGIGGLGGGFRIAFGIDGSRQSLESLSVLCGLQEDKIASVELLSMMKRNFYFGVSYSLEELNLWSGHEAAMKKKMQEAVHKARRIRPGVVVRGSFREGVSDVADALSEAAREKGAALLVVGSHEKDFLDRILLGSVSSKLSHSAGLPPFDLSACVVTLRLCHPIVGCLRCSEEAARYVRGLF